MMKVIRQVVFTPMKCGSCGNLEHVITCDKEKTDYFTNIYLCCTDCGNVSKVDPMGKGKEFCLDIANESGSGCIANFQDGAYDSPLPGLSK